MPSSKSSKRTSKPPKILLLDVGNTSITYGISQGRRLRFGSILKDDIPKLVKNFNKSGGSVSFHAVISSVNPKMTKIIRKRLSKIHGIKIWQAGRNLPLRLSHRYRPARSLGIDRRVNLYGAKKRYGGPALVIDFGTAVTFDLLSAKGHFEGGMIVPGPGTAFRATVEKAALIPKRWDLPVKRGPFLGNSTLACLESGTLEGYAALTEGLINRFKSIYSNKLRVIATGGYAKHLKPYTRAFDVYDPQHSIRSLLLLFQEFFA